MEKLVSDAVIDYWILEAELGLCNYEIGAALRELQARRKQVKELVEALDSIRGHADPDGDDYESYRMDDPESTFECIFTQSNAALKHAKESLRASLSSG